MQLASEQRPTGFGSLPSIAKLSPIDARHAILARRGHPKLVARPTTYREHRSLKPLGRVRIERRPARSYVIVIDVYGTERVLGASGGPLDAAPRPGPRERPASRRRRNARPRDEDRSTTDEGRPKRRIVRGLAKKASAASVSMASSERSFSIRTVPVGRARALRRSRPYSLSGAGAPRPCFCSFSCNVAREIPRRRAVSLRFWSHSRSALTIRPRS